MFALRLGSYKRLSQYSQETFCCQMSLLTGVGQFSAQHVICEIGFNAWILLYIYLHWKPF